ncbi:MAG: helicase [Microbacterium sp. 69-10]|uniref:helicase n=1 Tax=Microbacterium sp. 69-10 TaxID=1895783 RepID=UPI0009695997|nr:helicase [Microbacterium sp. 69-10]OJU41700.1 MAG: helicase [Microbacterium sp. 69-10]
MAGTALASGILAVAATLSLGLAAVGGAAVTAQRAAGAADAAALAAADAASGAIVTGEDPCALAAQVALAAGATLVACRADGLMVTVQVESAYAGLVAVSRARAGQPEG